MTFNYQEYFKQITPKTKMDVYNRFLFAFASVHTSWQSNIKGYLVLKNNYYTNMDSLIQTLNKSKLGLIKTRSKGIYDFTKKFLDNPKFYKKKRFESWQFYEERLIKDIYGLGQAKVAFVIELLYPLKAENVCTDVHILRWAKQPSSVSKGIHIKVKKGFLNHAKNHKTQPIEMRWKMWDSAQHKATPRYWSWVLESNPLELDELYKENYYINMIQ